MPSQQEERIKREMAITKYLRETYGLDDYSTLNAGEIEELCYMIVEDQIASLTEAHKVEMEKMVGEIKNEIKEQPDHTASQRLMKRHLQAFVTEISKKFNIEVK